MAAGGGNLNPVMEDPMESAEVVTLEHQEEMEVLQSIYDGDDRFRAINATTIQYKVGENDEPLSILIEIKWEASYPQSAPCINLDSFYNQHLPAIAKREAHSALMAEAQKNIGEQQTYGLIEWTKENILQVIGPHVFDEVCRLENRDSEQDPEGSKDAEQQQYRGTKKEQMTKAQKRREWDRMGKEGRTQRGQDWVDVVRHLSQTGGSTSGASGDVSEEIPNPPSS